MGSHAIEVPHSCQKWHIINILDLVHSALYMAHCIVHVLRLLSDAAIGWRPPTGVSASSLGLPDVK